MNLYELFEIAAWRAPGRIALRMPAEAGEAPMAPVASMAPMAPIEAVEWSYEELLARAAATAEGLRRWGLRRGDRVACLLGNGASMVTLHLALLQVGAVLVPLNLAYRRREIGHILSDAAPRLLIGEAEYLGLLDEVAVEDRATLEAVMTAEALTAAGDATEPAGPGSGTDLGAIGGDDLAMLLYTSGTTGPSKGARISHNNVLATVTGLLAAWRWSADDTMLLTLPLFHVHGLIVGLDCALAAGATVELRRRFVAQRAVEELEAGVATVFFGVPTLYVRLVEELRRRRAAGSTGSSGSVESAGSTGSTGSAGSTPQALAAVRLFCSGSAPLAAETFAAFRELTGHSILERYGMTETGMILSNPYLGPRVPGEVGLPLPGVSVRLMRRDGPAGASAPPPSPASPPSLASPEPGEMGELLVRGANVFAGYWQAPEKTAASFVRDEDGRRWFRTGDLARQDPSTGAFTLLGRGHEMILSGGFNVYPREIEETLLTFPGVHEAAVVGRPHAEWGEMPVAFLVADPDLEEAALRAFCKRELAGFKIPHQFHRVDTLPRNALGKLQKHLLPKT